MRVVTAVSLTVVLIACSPDEAASQEGASAQAESLLEGAGSLASSSDTALAHFSLAQSGTGLVSFASEETQGSAKVFSGVTFEGPGGNEATVETLRFVNPREVDGAMTFDALELINMAVQEDDAAVVIDRFVIAGPSPALAEVVAMALAGEEPGEDQEWGAPSDYGFAELALEGFSVAGEDGSELELLDIGEIRLSNMTGGVLEAFRFAGLDIIATGEDDVEVAVSLGEFLVRGLDLQALDEFSEVDMTDEEAVQAALLSSSFSNPYQKYYDDYALRDASVNAAGVMVSLESYEGRIDSTRVGLQSNDTLRGLTVSFDAAQPAGAQALEGLSMLGYEGFTIEGDFVQTMNEVEDTVQSDEFSLRVIDALALELDYNIGGIADYVKNASKLMGEPDLFAGAEMNPEQMMELYAPLILSNFEVRIIDDSIVERALQAAAEQQGSTPERARQQAIGMLAIGSMMAPPELQGLVGEAIEAATSFLEEPGSTLRIALAPEEPTPLVDVIAAFEQGDVQGGVDLLNLQVSSSAD